MHVRGRETRAQQRCDGARADSRVAWRDAEHDVELGRELSGLGILERREVDRHRLASSCIANATVDAIAFVLRMAIDVALCDELAFVRPLDLEVDMRRAAGIGDGLHGAEIVFTVGAGHEATEALEIGVALGVAVGRMEVNPAAVDLPDFDNGVAEWAAIRIEYATAEVSYLTDSWRDAVVDNKQIVIRVEGQVVWVKRTFGLRGGSLQRFCEGTSYVPKRRQCKAGACDCGALDELAT